MPAADRYRPGIDGWVVESRRSLPPTSKIPEPRLHVSWWYGPDHGWGTTWGPLDPSVRVFATFGDATAAAARVGLPIGKAKGDETVIRKVDAAERDELDRVTGRLHRYAAEGLDHPDADLIIDACHNLADRLAESLEARR